jgi:hypothetical protein
MRYHVKNPQGQELVVPSLDDLHDLYAHGFLGDEDLVRADTSERWTRLGSMRAMQGVRERRGDSRRMGLALIGAIALAAGIGFLLAR